MKVKLLNQTHPDYCREDLELRRALYEGGKAFHKHIGSFLPKHGVEGDDVWAERRRRAFYLNFVGPITDYIASALFSPPATLAVAEGDDDYWGDLAGDCDGQGSDWSALWKSVLMDALVNQRAWVRIDLPPVGESPPASRADQEAAGLLDAYLVRYAPEDVINWGTDRRGLAWVVIRRCESEQDGPVAERRRIWRWTAIDRTQVRTWTWTSPDGKAPDDEADAVEDPTVAHGFGALPIVRLELPHGLWVVNKLFDPAVELFRELNAHAWALYKSAHAMPVIKRKWGGDEPIVGTGYYYQLEPEDTFEWSEPPGHALAAIETAILRLREDLYRIVQQMAQAQGTSASQAAKSGDSKQMDHLALTVMLGAYAALVRDAMGQACRLLALARGEEVPCTLGGMDGWAEIGLVELLEVVTMAVPLVPSATFRRLSQQQVADRVLGDRASAEEREAIRTELEAAAEEPAPMDPGQDPPADPPR